MGSSAVVFVLATVAIVVALLIALSDLLRHKAISHGVPLSATPAPAASLAPAATPATPAPATGAPAAVA